MTGTPVNDAPTATNLSAARDLHRGHGAQPHRHRRQRHRQHERHRDVDAVEPAAGSLSTATSGAVTSTYVAAPACGRRAARSPTSTRSLAGVDLHAGARTSTRSFTIATAVSDGALVGHRHQGRHRHRGQRRADGDQPVGRRDVHRGHRAQPGRHRRHRRRQRERDGDPDAVEPRRRQPEHRARRARSPRPTAPAPACGRRAARSPTSTRCWPGVTFTPARELQRQLHDRHQRHRRHRRPGHRQQGDDRHRRSTTRPTATNLSAAETYTEDTALNLVDIVVSDVDSANVTATLTLSNTGRRQPQHRHLGRGHLDLHRGTGVWTASGAIANVNTLLAGRHLHAGRELQRQLHDRDQRRPTASPPRSPAPRT